MSPTAEGFTGSQVTLINMPAAPRFRSGYRYQQPSFVQAPTFIPTITDPEDPGVIFGSRQPATGRRSR